MVRHGRPLVAALMATSALIASPAFAQAAETQPGTAGTAAAAPAAAEETGEYITVTGTRTSGISASNSPAPIQVVAADALQRTGQPDLQQALAQNVPSLTVQAFGQDTAAFTVPARLRGLSPNQALVLINGKRRHSTANLSLGGFAYTGAASPDLSFIPVGSIARVEVLQDGAAAQYGSDAIAGVINLIQKTATHGGTFSVTGGQYFDGGGRTGDASINVGLAPTANSYLNLTAQAKYHGASFRGDYDPRTIDPADRFSDNPRPVAGFPQLAGAPDFPYLNRFSGDPRSRLYVASYNAGIKFSEAAELYSFGSYGHKLGISKQVYRLPNVVRGVSPTDIPFPLGFTPKEQFKEDDFEVALGLKGDLAGWSYDLTSSYGKDFVALSILDSANADLYRDNSTATTPGSSPRDFLAGKFRAAQWTNTLDVRREVGMGLAEPVTLAGGLEYRKDYYQILPGDPASYYKGGSQSFFGLAPRNAGKYDRDSFSAYLDIALKPVEPWLVELAARYSDFSDFGSTTVFKGTTRFDISRAFAIRGTVATGFRAPTLAESFYSGVNVTPSAILGQLASNSAGARLIGVPPLQPEKSTNLSGGLVIRPAPRLTLTVDAYQIKIRDRIFNTGRLLGDAANKSLILNPGVLAAIAANGINVDPTIFTSSAWTIGVNIFANGLDTRTRGVDVLLTYNTDFGGLGRLNLSLGGNYNETKVTRIGPNPSGLDPRQVLFDAVAIANLEQASPKYKIVADAAWSLGRLTVNFRNTLYGKAASLNLDSFGTPTFRKNVVGPEFITDLEVGYRLFDGIRLAVGANNLFNVYPDRFNHTLRDNWFAQRNSNYTAQYPQVSPWGINGGYYYGRISVDF